MRFRKLRIAWTVACGILCLLLTVLWVRSHRMADGICFPVSGSDYIGFGSVHGTMTAYANKYRSGYFEDFWELRSDPIPDPRIIDYHVQAHPAYRGAFGFGIINSSPQLTLCTPHWSLIVFALLFAALPWTRMKCRFRLSALLIATTLFAVMLGIIAWMLRTG